MSAFAHLRNGLLLGVVLAGALAASACGGGGSDGGGGDAQSKVKVQVWVLGELVARFTGPLADAEKQANEIVGFTINLPKETPSGSTFTVFSLSVPMGGAGNKTSTTTVAHEKDGFELEQAAKKLTPEGNRVSGTEERLELYKAEKDGKVIYTRLTPSATYILIPFNVQEFSQEDAVKVLGSLPDA